MGWPWAFRFLSILVWVIGIIVVALVKPSPEAIGSFPDGEKPETSLSEEHASPEVKGWEAGEAVRTRSFWMVWMTVFCLIAALTMVIFHGPSYAMGQGLPSGAVALIFGIMGLISVLGRIGSGRFGDYLAKRGMHPVHARRYMYCFSGLLMGIGAIILLQVTSLSWLWIWAVVFGIGYGTHVPQLAAITGDLFGRKNLGFIMSLVGISCGLAGIIGPYFAGWVYDTAQNYAVAFQVAALLCFLAMIFSLLTVIPKRRALSDQLANGPKPPTNIEH
jgi:OFA family oxalate/formate antiporter-like MFS transporter